MSAIKFSPNIPKIIEALLWITGRRPGIDVYHVIKIIFAADCYHLSRFGRPVTGDYYVAVQHGVMPSIAKDIIDEDIYTLKHCGITKSPLIKNGYSLHAARDFDRDKFSKSDIEALEYGLSEYANIPTFSGVREKNHQHPAWINAAKKQGFDMSKETEFVGLHQLVDFEDMIEDNTVLDKLKELDELTERMIV
jgi:hypothetical protein